MCKSILLLTVVAALGCARRPHTNPEFGRANRSAFDRQARSTERGSGQGLDSEEAAAIEKRYQQSLGNASQRRNDPGSSVLILEDNNHVQPKK